MRYAYFLGCTVPYRESNYDLSTRKVMERLGVELIDLDDPGCCGLVYQQVDKFKWLCLSARIISMAEERNLDLLVLCNGCNGSCVKANRILKEDASLREKVNGVLKVVDREYKGTVEVKHLVKALYQDIGLKKIRQCVQKPLSLKIAAFYGCHLIKPSSELRFEYIESAQSLDLLVEATGAQSIDYYEKEQCCGAYCGGFSSELNEALGHCLASQKLVNARDAGADAMVTICPFCHVMLDFNQKAIENLWKQEFQMPVLHYPQLLGLAMGYGIEELGLTKNRVKLKTEVYTLQHRRNE